MNRAAAAAAAGRALGMTADEDEDGGGGGTGLAAGGSAGLLQRAVLALQTPSSSLHERIVALRQLRVYVGQHRELDEATRANINQLVLDNVLGIVLSEDRTTDLRRRQLLRTECFLMLASLLTLGRPAAPCPVARRQGRPHSDTLSPKRTGTCHLRCCLTVTVSSQLGRD